MVMHNIKKIIKICSLLILAVSVIACKKFVEVDPPKTEIITAEAFKENASATSAVLSIYVNMLSNFSFENSGITIYPGLSANEFEDFFQSTEGLEFQQNKLLPTNATINSMWSGAYRTLALANNCIEGLEQSTTLSPEVKNQLLGECKFSRAFVNFYLVNLWGDVPLVLTSDWRQNATIMRSQSDQVYQQILRDLKDAQLLLKDAYPTQGRVRINKWAATALLARTFLYMEDYENAEVQASAVIGSGAYLPLPELNQAFLKESQEAIWQLMPNRRIVLSSQEGYAFIGDTGYGSPPNYPMTDALLSSFEDGDGRKSAWINQITYENQTYYYPFKYKDRGDYNAATPSEYYIMLRLSEQFMIRAEARARLNKLDLAAQDLKVIRDRAGLDELPLMGQQELIKAIENENRHEFFAEWGHRWMDLKRTGRIDAVMTAEKPGWKSTAALFPVPQAEREVNKQLTQNPGYN